MNIRFILTKRFLWTILSSWKYRRIPPTQTRYRIRGHMCQKIMSRYLPPGAEVLKRLQKLLEVTTVFICIDLGPLEQTTERSFVLGFIVHYV
ncbi:hypothetical protein TNCT_195081 [Trichonephila clavata]|uniref:Uncharacterized protein n=1 Tax=Trichonephila clavata TaxID=2740835 RepID=A0A8X6ILE9_TRICU|nr:hypothetical protein TNCT_195081 [Trichonephila clavata]